MAQHTEGPWRIDKPFQGPGTYIAAAPLLLDELKQAHAIITDLWALAQKHSIPDWDHDWPLMREVQRNEAIKKATEGTC